MELREAIALASQRRARRKLFSYMPYPWQWRFHNEGLENPERMLMSANRVGKTQSAGKECVYHARGEYPDWWDGEPTPELRKFWSDWYAPRTGDLRWRDKGFVTEWCSQFKGGRRFTEATDIWIGSMTAEASRDTVQYELLGEPKGTGSIPHEWMTQEKPWIFRQAGVANVVETISVQSAHGGVSTIGLKSYDQGWEKWQGVPRHLVWLDEEPKQYKIFTEALTRTLDKAGLMIATNTPLVGETEFVQHFYTPKEGSRGIVCIQASWNEAPHLDDDAKERLKASYEDYEVETRTTGAPMMGTGRVFKVREEDIKVDPFQIPRWFRRIGGLDFGIDHPFAGSWLAYDPEKDIVYVTDCYRSQGQLPPMHVAALRRGGGWIPWAWPHDGLQRGKADGQPLWRQYQAHGLNMFSMSARYENDKGGGQPVEPVVLDVHERMQTGRFKVFSTCMEFFEEFRNYHRDENGKIVAKRDDVLKATFYAYMMRRYATTPVVRKAARIGWPMLSMR